ncbi:MAG: DUF3084 domain-containing protein [Meiothermus sp.]|nr:DUF3084 domain-containing protein [Meiothermus sp.]
MTFWAILILLLVVAGVVAYVGDAVAKRVGKWHWRLFGLRPRTTGTLVAVGTGMLIALGAFSAFFLSVRDARETILQAEQVRQERNRLQAEVERLENRAAATFSENERLKSERSEFERNIEQQAKQLESNVELQKQTRQDLENALIEQEKLAQQVGKQRAELQRLEASRQQIAGEKDQLQASRAQLLSNQSQLAERADRAQQQLTALEAASRNALSRFSDLQRREQTLQTRVTELETRSRALQARSRQLEAQKQSLEAEKRGLEAEKRNLEGDVSVLIAASTQASINPTEQPAENPLRVQLEAARTEILQLRSTLQTAQRDLQLARERSRQITASLDKALGGAALAETPTLPGFEQDNLAELLRRAESRARLLGLRGLEVVENAAASGQAGLLIARVSGVSPEGKARVRLEFRLREQVFSTGEVLATASLTAPITGGEIQRRLEALNQLAHNRLVQANWIPEKLEQGGIPLQEFINLADQLEGKRGVMRVAVVALGDLYPTEAPRLGLRLLP